MENEETEINKWDLLASIMPSGIELNELSEDECEITDGENTVKVIDNGESYIVNNTSLHFEDTNIEIMFTMLLPYILQELDGNRRL